MLKDSMRVEAYGNIDEANAAVGQAKATLDSGPWRQRLHAIQHRLFVLAAEVASDDAGVAQLSNKIDSADIAELEELIDDCLKITGPQRAFVVPGRDERSAVFHNARTIVRRAERRLLTLSSHESVRPELIKYLNRLSDAIYAVARVTEHWSDLATIERIVRDTVAAQLTAADSAPPLPATAGTEQQRLTLTLAKSLITAAEHRALDIQVPVVISVVDPAGQLVAMHRMDDSLLVSLDLATNKAWTSVALRQPTGNLTKLAQPDGALPGIASSNGGRVVLFGGGFPLISSDALIGGIGVSGGTVEQDCEIAAWAIAQVLGGNDDNRS